MLSRTIKTAVNEIIVDSYVRDLLWEAVHNKLSNLHRPFGGALKTVGLQCTLSLITVAAWVFCSAAHSQPRTDNPQGYAKTIVNTDSAIDVELSDYIKTLTLRIQKHWFPPKDGRSSAVSFELHTDGTISHLQLRRSSGILMCDQPALEAIAQAAPFKPLPDGDGPLYLTFVFSPFVFPATTTQVTVLSEVDQPSAKDYERELIVRTVHWMRPEGAGDCTLSFYIKSDGAANNLMIEKSSGSAKFDEFAQRAIELASPYPNPPNELIGKKILTRIKQLQFKQPAVHTFQF